MKTELSAIVERHEARLRKQPQRLATACRELRNLRVQYRVAHAGSAQIVVSTPKSRYIYYAGTGLILKRGEKLKPRGLEALLSLVRNELQKLAEKGASHG